MNEKVKLKVEYVKLEELIPFELNARIHSKEQVGQIVNSIGEFDFVNPILVGIDNMIIAGHGRLRMRGQMALDGFSTAGPIDAYKFFALSASVKVKSVDVRSDEPGKVIVTILSTEGDGTAVRRESVSETKITVTDGKATLSGKSIDHLVVKDVSGGQTYKENFDYTFDKANSLLAVTVDSKISNNTELLVSYERATVSSLDVLIAADNKDKTVILNEKGDGFTVTPSKEIFQNIFVVTGNTVEVSEKYSIYKKTISANTALDFNVTKANIYQKVITFELFIEMPKKFSISFVQAAKIHWLNDEVAEFDEAGNYLLAFRSFDNGASWVGSLQGMWT